MDMCTQTDHLISQFGFARCSFLAETADGDAGSH